MLQRCLKRCFQQAVGFHSIKKYTVCAYTVVAHADWVGPITRAIIMDLVPSEASSMLSGSHRLRTCGADGTPSSQCLVLLGLEVLH